MAGAGAPSQTAAFGRKLALLLIAAAVPIGRAVSRDDRKTTAKCWSVHGHASGCSHQYGQAFCAIPGLQCQDLKCLALGVSKGTCECKCGWYATPPTAENGWYWGCKQYDPNQPWDPDPDVMREQRKSGECPEDSDETPPQKLSKEPTTSVATSQAPLPTTTGYPAPTSAPAATTLAPLETTTPSPTTTTEEVAITTGAATTTKKASVCCMALKASCLACNQGVMVEEFCKGSPDTPGCETISTTKDLLASVLATGLIKDDAKEPGRAATSTTVFDEAMMPEEAAKEADDVAAAPADAPAEESESTTTQPATTTAENSTTASVFWRLYGDRGRAAPARPRSATAATALLAGVGAVTVAMSALLVLRQHGRIYRHANEADEERAVPPEERVLL